jgi:GntR family transcriptional regulator, rspAB operon transcriptional repressor
MPRSKPQINQTASKQLRTHARELRKPGQVRGSYGIKAYEAIRAAILECSFLPGAALSEQALSEGMAISRAPVRDALRQLAAEGLVQVIPQRGTFVALISPEKVRDAVFVREVIECRAAAMACQAPLHKRRELLDLLATQRTASDQGDYATHLASDETLHLRILELAGHPHAWASLRLARTGMNRIRHLAIPVVGSHRIALDHHQLIVQAIIDGDATQAAEHMRVHIQSPLQFLDAIAKHFPHYIEN